MGSRGADSQTPGKIPGMDGGFSFHPSTASRSQAATLDLKSKEEKDAELDKRIEALRRKNEALIRRYQVP